MNIMQYKNLANKKPSKLKNIKTNGYDSARESRRAAQLKFMQKQDIISELKEQVRFKLLESFKDSSGKTERGISYIADFVYTENSQLICEDSKGFKTIHYIIKRKLFKSKYPQYIFKET